MHLAYTMAPGRGDTDLILFKLAGELASRGLVILPVLTGFGRRIHAAIFSFCAGVMPPMPMLGRSLL